MSYTVDSVQRQESTKTTSKAIAQQIFKKREAEIALDLFKVGWPGERLTFRQLCEEFEQSHLPTLSESSRRNHRVFLRNLTGFLGNRSLPEIDAKLIEQYQDHRRRAAGHASPQS